MDRQDQVTIGELARAMARIEEKLDEALSEQGKLKTDMAVLKTKVAFVSSTVAGAAVLLFEGAKAFLGGK